MSLLPAIAMAAVTPTADYATVTALYSAAASNDEPRFAASIDTRFGMFVADDFVVPMKFADFKQFAGMCKSPAFLGANDEASMKGVKAVSVQMACTAPKATAAVSRNFEFWVANGKVVAIRPEGMN